MTSPGSPFVSTSVPRHLARGIGGLLAVVASFVLLRAGGPLGLLGALCAGGLGVALLRGCPMCWFIGLVDTMASRDRAPMASVEREHL